LDVIKTADWVIDMGPEGGSGGGTVVAEGTPEDVAAMPESHTGQYLQHMLQPAPVPTRARKKVAAASARRSVRTSRGAARSA
jgi:excinuclease ABC subunit A